MFHATVESDVQTIYTARELAKRMAGITHLLREALDQSFRSASHAVIAWLSQWLASFRETLIPELKESEFADMFAQTLAYGLFAARIQTAKSGTTFSRAEALLAVPKSNPFLRKIFSEFAGEDMPEDFKWAVDDLVRLLEKADIGRILADFGKETGQNDPIVHFYETFLAAYDPKLREKRGVYYTPEPVVRYIVRSVDSLLKTHFNKRRGLADEKTLILDPATGTATFLYEVIAQVRESMTGQEGGWPSYVREHLLRRIFGFELLMAPYAVAHLKLGLELEQTGYKFAEGERLGIYLTNTLEEAAMKSERLIAKAISDEAEAAADIKREKPILVVLGNPPYSGHSANRSRDRDGNLTFIGALMEDYKRDVPSLSKPAQAKWLQDDYAKFLRFAQWRIARTGSGIVAFVTNNGYLDNPTFLGMRRSLLESFDEIYICDLHGSTKRRETADDGTPDQNVFDIQQGVALFIAIAREPRTNKVGRLFLADIRGSRSNKYRYLESHSVASTKWAETQPRQPAFTFVASDVHLEKEYVSYPSVKEIFSPREDPAAGLVTTHDTFAISFTPSETVEKIRTFLRAAGESEARSLFSLCGTTQWNYASAVKSLSSGAWENNVKPIAYRPFDTRFTVYDRYVAVHRRDRAMRYMLGGGNVALCVGRAGSVVQGEWTLAYCVDHICDFNLFYRGGCVVMPLHKSESQGFEFNAADFSSIDAGFVRRLEAQLQKGRPSPTPPSSVTSDQIFGYVYSVLYSRKYRNRYGELLKRDFPRIPFTSDFTLFRTLAEKGNELVALHLLRVEAAPQLENVFTMFPVAGSNGITHVKYDQSKQRVAINDDQYFANVPLETWTFQIGGYQVLEKWLKDRRGRTLTFDDLRHWQRIAVSLTETRRVMDEIDGLIPAWPLA